MTEITGNPSSLSLNSGRKLLYATNRLVEISLAENGYSANMLHNSSDLESGKYEGGLKIWEGAIDLCNFIEDPAFFKKHIVGKRILELGCGAALPSITALVNGASEAVVNDFNDFVLRCFTSQNFRLNNIPDSKWNSIPGTWSSLCESDLSPKSYDVILTSETIYNEQYYASLHDVMDKFLADDGIILLAAKVYYFGLGTSIDDFEKYLNEKCVFKATEVWRSSDSSVPRKILQLSRTKT
ncbi:lysine methyltransferase domain-containing protein [Ditylenchus destructor]|nr:lysine methyltransferase domain-containing protein [Ditylenchus destructor]